MPKNLPWPRLLNIFLAGELFLFTMHGEHLANRTLVVALFMTALITAFELMSLMEPSVRFATMLMGAILVGEAFLVKHWLPEWRWHDAIVGALVMLISLVPNKAVPAPEGDPITGTQPKS